MKKLNPRIHPVWLVAWGVAGILLGIALSAGVPPGLFSGPEVLIIALSFAGIAFMRRRASMVALAFIAGMLFGLWRGALEQHALTAYQDVIGQRVTVSGVVAEDASYGPNGDQRLRLRAVEIANHQLPGIIWVSTEDTVDIKRGDGVTVQGLLTEGFGNLPASMHRAQVISVERPYPGDIARRVRDWFTESVRRAIPEPESSLSVGYLAGQRSALPEALNEQLKTVGLTHAVVASGYNLTILVSFARRSLMRFSKYLAALAAGILVVSFVMITGLSPSMSRAGLVSLLSLGAWYYGRSIHPVVLLLVSATATAIWRPAYVWGDMGWYLSFTAFTGVIILAPLLKRYFFGGKKFGMVRQILLDTVSAQLLTMPIILYAFGQYATYALFANVLVLPLVPLAMLLTFMAGIGGLVVPSMAIWFGWPARIILSLNVLAIEWISRLPGAYGDIKFTLYMLAGSYVLLMGGMTYMWHKTRYNYREAANEQITVF